MNKCQTMILSWFDVGKVINKTTSCTLSLSSSLFEKLVSVRSWINLISLFNSVGKINTKKSEINS